MPDNIDNRGSQDQGSAAEPGTPQAAAAAQTGIPNAGAAIGGTPPNAPPPAPPPQPQVDPVKEHHAAMGHAISRVAAALEGKEISYVPDEQNPGQIRQVVQPRKAGGFWRDVVLGAVAGGAAGAESPNRQTALGGAALGARAGLSAQEAGQEKRKAQAQQTADEYKRDQDRLFQQSQIAANTISNLVLDHHADLHNPTKLNAYNTSQGIIKKLAIDNGAIPAQIMVGGKDINGTGDNGGPLMAMFQKAPSP